MTIWFICVDVLVTLIYMHIQCIRYLINNYVRNIYTILKGHNYDSLFVNTNKPIMPINTYLSIG